MIYCSTMYSLTAYLREEEDDYSNLQLAAELGKTLLERNQELEETVRQQQLLIEEQAQEIEYLSRQTVSLREVNESRLKIYEQLEQNVAELEKSNQRLQQESRADKKRIKSLCTSVDILEKKCEELQEVADSLNSSSRKKPSQTSDGDEDEEEDLGKNCAHDADAAFAGFEESPFESEVVRLRSALSRFKCQIAKEHEQKEEMQAEIDSLIQENMHLQEQVLASQEREHQCLNLQMEMDLLDDKNMCPSCRIFTASNQHPGCEPEEELAELDHFAMMQLKNGVVVYGDQDSLPADVEATAIATNPSAGDATQTQDAENQVSLLSELDTQYRALIEKYEALLDARCRSLNDERLARSPDMAGKKGDYASLSTMSDTESAESSLSSGFSEPTENRCLADQAVQTELSVEERKSSSTLNLTAVVDPVSQRFTHSPPEYKKLFAEIFAVLKQTVQDKIEVLPEVPERKDMATSPIKRADPAKRATSEAKPPVAAMKVRRKLNTSLDLSKLCDIEKKHGPTFPFVAVQSAKVQSPGSLTYAEAVRKGCIHRHRTQARLPK
ncbi:cerebellar degeneration-related protein 2-like isoform X2 [Ornithodoros turicata]|uniref:cerebellar degeneration-related protein 2-like isoform X2 n=1 Tax=Ornithodoros turicata TaxID=34597 RepID=UPI003138FE4B